jgi:hypothetical protein
MNSKNIIQAVISLLLVFFLCAPLALRTVSERGFIAKKVNLDKTSGGAAKLELQLLFEEKEKEEKFSEEHTHPFFIVFELPYFNRLLSERQMSEALSPASVWLSAVPVYLATRSLRI